MKIGVNLTEAEAKAFKARKEQELGPGWCVDVYESQGHWRARAYPKGKRGPKPGTKYRSRSKPRPSGTAASATGAASQ
jgi:hypothetical protein